MNISLMTVEKYVKKLQKSFDEIDKLATVPNMFKKVVLNALEPLTKDQHLTNLAKKSIENVMNVIKNIQPSSISDEYKIIFNLSCVLAVSSLAATIEEFFKNHVNSNLKNIKTSKEPKLTLQEIASYDFNLKKHVGTLIIEKDPNINFQSLRHILETFEKYLTKEEITIPEELSAKVVFYHQCRHAIVHEHSKVSERFIRSTKQMNANVKKYAINDMIQLDSKDWDELKKVFLNLVELLIKNVTKND